MRSVFSFGTLSLMLAAFSASACIVTPLTLARTRASREFNCPEEAVQLRQRTDFSWNTYDVNACGHRARYTCIVSRYTNACAREPMEPDATAPQPAPSASEAAPPSLQPAQ